MTPSDPLMPTMVADSPAPSFDVTNVRYLGQFQKLYLLIERGEELLIMDQHAAAERVHYERLLNLASEKKVLRQSLLTPVLWDLSPSQAEMVGSYLDEFDALGFGLEAFGPQHLCSQGMACLATRIR